MRDRKMVCAICIPDFLLFFVGPVCRRNYCPLACKIVLILRGQILGALRPLPFTYGLLVRARLVGVVMPY